jgi:hypothetical protein
MKIKSVIKKSINPLLLILSAALMFAHLFFKEERNAWYCRDVEKNISIICLSGFFYRTRQHRHGLLNKLYKCAFSFLFLKCSFNLAEENIAWIYNIHLHKISLAVQSIPLSIICMFIIYYLMEGHKWKQKDLK